MSYSPREASGCAATRTSGRCLDRANHHYVFCSQKTVSLLGGRLPEKSSGAHGPPPAATWCVRRADIPVRRQSCMTAPRFNASDTLDAAEPATIIVIGRGLIGQRHGEGFHGSASHRRKLQQQAGLGRFPLSCVDAGGKMQGARSMRIALSLFPHPRILYSPPSPLFQFLRARQRLQGR